MGPVTSVLDISPLEQADTIPLKSKTSLALIVGGGVDH